MKTAVILISGRGSNMQAILAAPHAVRVAAVISNDPRAAGLAIARKLGVQALAIDHRSFPNRESFDVSLANAIDAIRPDIVALAGFMRILTASFVERFRGRLVNIHPSLLPAFPGLDTHRRALAAGVRIHGCTVHFVTPELDSGPIIIQAAVPVLPDDDEERLAARVLEQEHRIYPQALRWMSEGKITLDANDRVSFPHARATPELLAPALDP